MARCDVTAAPAAAVPRPRTRRRRLVLDRLLVLLVRRRRRRRRRGHRPLRRPPHAASPPPPPPAAPEVAAPACEVRDGSYAVGQIYLGIRYLRIADAQAHTRDPTSHTRIPHYPTSVTAPHLSHRLPPHPKRADDGTDPARGAPPLRRLRRDALVHRPDHVHQAAVGVWRRRARERLFYELAGEGRLRRRRLVRSAPFKPTSVLPPYLPTPRLSPRPSPHAGTRSTWRKG